MSVDGANGAMMINSNVLGVWNGTGELFVSGDCVADILESLKIETTDVNGVYSYERKNLVIYEKAPSCNV